MGKHSKKVRLINNRGRKAAKMQTRDVIERANAERIARLVERLRK